MANVIVAQLLYLDAVDPNKVCCVLLFFFNVCHTKNFYFDCKTIVRFDKYFTQNARNIHLRTFLADFCV